MDFRRFSIAGLLLALCACQQPSVVDYAQQASPPTAGSTSAPQSDSAQPEGRAMQNPDLPATTASDVVVKICGNARFSIATTKGPGDRTQTQLYRSDRSGNRIRIQPPAEMDDYGPVALGCTSAANGDVYLVVEYGAADGYGCAFCEWVYLYDGNGKQLTSSIPPVLEDPSLPGTQQQYPNSREYEAKLKELGLKHPELDYRP